MYVSSQDVVQQWISDSKQTIIWNVSCSREKLLVSDNTQKKKDYSFILILKGKKTA
jgi:hypothetical protein